MNGAVQTHVVYVCAYINTYMYIYMHTQITSAVPEFVLFITSFHFCGRPILVPVFVNQEKSEEDFHFYPKKKKKKKGKRQKCYLALILQPMEPP